MDFLRTLSRRKKYLVIALIIVLLLGWKHHQNSQKTDTRTRAAVTTGAVRSLVSVSGVVDAVNTAKLAFPIGGVIETLPFKEGATVTKGVTLATLVHDDLRAQYLDASAALNIAEADHTELVNGMRPQEQAIAKTKLEIAQEDLTRITKEQDDRLENARRTLLSSSLSVLPEDLDRTQESPTITGTYHCGEGTYTLDIYRSGAASGYSYRLSGLETGDYTAYSETPNALGTCGLQIQFPKTAGYGNSRWHIEVPNTHSTVYVTNLNTYNLAKTEHDNAISAAKEALTLATQNNDLSFATPRDEALTRSNAKVTQAGARVEAIGAQIRDHTLFAPFDGTITSVTPVVGESVGTGPVITMVSNDTYELTALIPEIDVTKIKIGEKAEVRFDARHDDVLKATIFFISPLAQKIDGVSYFEAKMTLDDKIDWLKSGLNADIDIIADVHDNVSRIPNRYLVEKDGKSTVLIPGKEKNTTENKGVTVPFRGNDGFVEVQGIDVGTTIIAP